VGKIKIVHNKRMRSFRMVLKKIEVRFAEMIFFISIAL